MLRADAPVRIVKGQFRLTDKRSDGLLRDAIMSAGQGSAALGGRGVTIPLYDQGQHTAHLLPLSAQRGEMIRAAAEAAFIVFIRAGNRRSVEAAAALAQRFGLTTQETRVLETVVDVGGVPLAAEVLGVSATTVRSHITAIFDKTGVRRQADLIRLLTDIQSPFASA